MPNNDAKYREWWEQLRHEVAALSSRAYNKLGPGEILGIMNRIEAGIKAPAFRKGK